MNAAELWRAEPWLVQGTRFLLQAERTRVSSLVPSFAVALARPVVTMRRLFLLLKACIFSLFQEGYISNPQSLWENYPHVYLP